jgi:hypothetical protein
MNDKFLSLDWFKQTAENAIAKVVAEKLESLMEQEKTPFPKEKVYANVRLVNDTLTVVMKDGSVFSKPGATEEDYYAIVSALDEYEIRSIVASKEVVADVEKIKVEAAKMKALQQGIQLLNEIDDFTVEGTTVYLTGTSRSLPQLLVEEFIQVVDRVSHDFID